MCHSLILQGNPFITRNKEPDKLEFLSNEVIILTGLVADLVGSGPLLFNGIRNKHRLWF